MSARRRDSPSGASGTPGRRPSETSLSGSSGISSSTPTSLGLRHGPTCIAAWPSAISASPFTAAGLPARPRPPELQARVPPASAAPVSATSYWIQLGAFTRPDAGEIASRLLEQSLPVSMDRVAIPTSHRGQLLLRVRVGPFSDHAEAVSKLRDLQTNGYQAFIAREPD